MVSMMCRNLFLGILGPSKTLETNEEFVYEDIFRDDAIEGVIQKVAFSDTRLKSFIPVGK